MKGLEMSHKVGGKKKKEMSPKCPISILGIRGARVLTICEGIYNRKYALCIWC